MNKVRDENIPPATTPISRFGHPNRESGGRDDTGEVVVGIILFLAFVAFLYFANGGH